MAENELKRKLVAILSADVAEYSRLMSDDEEATVLLLNRYREVMTGLIRSHSGKVIDSPGDNLLAAFNSVVDSLRCAWDIQQKLAARNDLIPENRRMNWRIGINLGDIIEQKGKLYGDGVNVAARLESLADPGGINISGTAYDQVKRKLPYNFRFVGEQEVKNITDPVRVYKLLAASEDVGKLIKEQKLRSSKKTFIAAIAAVLILAAGAIWFNYPRTPIIEPASVDKMAFSLPDKPSIAVLPFTNMSGDAEQEYFSDGVTEDLITDLSKISGLFVIARNSVFTYKGKAVKIRQVAEELGVRYVLEGSVRRSQGQVRINAQLIDATTGGHLWADRYDGQMDNIFALQDAITHKIVSALEVELTGREEEQAASHETNSIEAYDFFLKGWAHYHKKTVNDAKLALVYFENAVNLDPNYTLAYAALAGVYLDIFSRLWYDTLGLASIDCRIRAKESLQKSMKNPRPLTYQVSSQMYIYYRKHEMAIIDAEQAIAMDPNDPESYAAMANALVFSGRAGEALAYIKKAMRLDPHYPAFYLNTLGLAYFGMDKYKEAADSFERCLERKPSDFWRIEALIASYALSGKEVKAKAMADELKKRTYDMDPLYLIGKLTIRYDYKNKEDLLRLEIGFRKAMLD